MAEIRDTTSAKLSSLSSLSLQQGEEAKQRRVVQEEAFAKLRGELGKPEEADPATPAEYAAPGVSPDAWVDYQKGTAEFKTMSALTRTAQGLATRSGPEWERLTQSVTGPIIEGSAAMLRDQAELLRNEFARGGMRRSRAREAMLQVRNIESANVAKQQQLWNANLALTQWGAQFANEQVTQYNKLYAENAGGIRDSFNTAMDAAGNLLAQTSIPFAGRMAIEVGEQASAKAVEDRAKRQRTYAIAGGALAALTGAVVGGPLGTQIGLAGVGAAGSAALPGMGFEQMIQTGGLLGSAASQLFGKGEGGGGAGDTLSSLTDFSQPGPGEGQGYGVLAPGGAQQQEPGLAERLTQGPLGGPVQSLFGIGEPGAGLVGKVGGAIGGAISGGWDKISSIFGSIF
jgi:hypothetical protein